MRMGQIYKKETRSKRSIICLAFCLFFCLSFSYNAFADQKYPHKVISFDLCIDQLLLDIVPKEKIAAITFLTSNPDFSVVSDKAQDLPITNGSVEDVFKYKADLVLVGNFESQTKIHLLKKLGHRVEIMPLALTPGELKGTIRELGKLTGYEKRAEALIASFEKNLKELKTVTSAQKNGKIFRAIYLAANRHTQGEKSVVNTLLELSGYVNMALETGLREGGFISLENLIAANPDLILLSKAKTEAPSLATQKLSHPAMKYLATQTGQIDIEQKYLLCLSPKVVEAALLLIKIRAGASYE